MTLRERKRQRSAIGKAEFDRGGDPEGREENTPKGNDGGQSPPFSFKFQNTVKQ